MHYWRVQPRPPHLGVDDSGVTLGCIKLLPTSIVLGLPVIDLCIKLLLALLHPGNLVTHVLQGVPSVFQLAGYAVLCLLQGGQLGLGSRGGLFRLGKPGLQLLPEGAQQGGVS